MWSKDIEVQTVFILNWRSQVWVVEVGLFFFTGSARDYDVKSADGLVPWKGVTYRTAADTLVEAFEPGEVMSMMLLALVVQIEGHRWVASHMEFPGRSSLELRLAGLIWLFECRRLHHS